MNKKALLYNQDLFQGVHLVYECNHCNEARDEFYWQITDIVEAALKHRLENHTN